MTFYTLKEIMDSKELQNAYLKEYGEEFKGLWSKGLKFNKSKKEGLKENEI